MRDRRWFTFLAVGVVLGMAQAVTATTGQASPFNTRYRRMTAIGTRLQYGELRSAAADWSVFPLGTKFRIEGDSNTYLVEDYGSALVGKSTIDLYMPTRRSMNRWGVRNVNIKIVEWGSFECQHWLSEQSRYWHVRQMARDIRSKLAGTEKRQRGGRDLAFSSIPNPNFGKR